MDIFLPGTFLLHAVFLFESFTPPEKEKGKEIQLNKQIIRKKQQQQGRVDVDKGRKTWLAKMDWLNILNSAKLIVLSEN